MDKYLTKTRVVDGKPVTLYSTDSRSWSARREDLNAWERRKARQLRSLHEGNKAAWKKLQWPPTKDQL